MRVEHFALFLLIFMPANCVAVQPNCIGPADLARVKATQEQLFKVPVGEMQTNVPSAVSEAIDALKDALTAAIDDEISCSAQDAPADSLEARLGSALHANEPEKQPNPASDIDAVETGVFGSGLEIHISAPANQPRLRVVEAGFGIRCGKDTVLLVYEYKGQKWHRTLRWQRHRIREISDAFGDMFQYAVLPGTDQQSWRLVTIHGHPWCTSRFSGFDLDLLEPGSNPNQPRTIWHTERGYSRGDYPARLRATNDGFEFRVNEVALSPEGYERTVVYHYRVAGNEVSRIPPVAVNGRGFVEEWLSMPWTEAEAETDSAAVPKLEQWHNRLERLDKDAKTYVLFEYGPVRQCSTKNMYEVEMDPESGGAQFYIVGERPNGYSMMDMRLKHDEQCNGPDLMRTTR